MTLQDKVQSYIGTFSDTSSLTSWLVESVHKLINQLPRTVLEQYSSDLAEGGSGIAIGGYKVLRAHKSVYEAQIISAGLKSSTLDSGSVYYATATSPTAYIENGVGYVKPGGGTFITLAYPALTYATVAGSSQFLTDFEDYIVLPVAIKATEQNLSTAQAQMKTYTETDEDAELAASEGQRVQALSNLLTQLKSEYDNLMKNIL